MDTSELDQVKRKSVKTKFILAIIGVSIIVGASLIFSNVYFITKSLEDFFAEEISERVESFYADYTDRGSKIINSMSLVHESSDLPTLIRENNDMKITSYLTSFCKAASVTSAHITAASGFFR